MIEVRSVTKRYGRTVVVDDVELTLPAGGLVSIIGPNGAGKSTLLSIVARLLPADAGSVLVDGHDVASTPGDVLARRLAVLRQENHLTVRLTVRDLVAFGRYPHSRGRLTTTDEAHVDAALEHLGLTDLAGRFLDQLSGGQRQRAHVAMVLAQDTEYVLLDEPLNNLDMKHARQMMRMMRRAADELGRTVVVVLHDINFAAAYSDRVVAMRDGAVVVQGTPAQIMTPEALHAVYDMDIAVHDVAGAPLAAYYV
ncbi:ABC transporter ATP-binding protein [Oerskovia flava]|uniref:iron ABC transporter ATP-binding protein n=1 Tax=Oerskovia flava TaxID=2986422 RepID=UPI00223EEBBC|nr:ATP-binding cassette domain-containing protein [Oerskovia sp. JB1-3-2]